MTYLGKVALGQRAVYTGGWHSTPNAVHYHGVLREKIVNIQTHLRKKLSDPEEDRVV